MSKEAKKSEFEGLLEELDVLQKSMQADQDDADDAKIQTAGKADEDENAEGIQDGGGDENAEGEGDPISAEDDEVMGKSFTVTMADGTEVEALDGTELVKSFMARMQGTETEMSKALKVAVSTMQDMGQMLKSQAQKIHGLQETVNRLANEGRGRKAVVHIHDKGQTLSKSHEQDGLKPAEFMGKALSAQKAGRITGHEVALAESCLNRGQQVPEHIVKKVVSEA